MKFDNDCDAIFMFKMLIEHGYSCSKSFIIYRTNPGVQINAAQHSATRRNSSQVAKLKVRPLQHVFYYLLTNWFAYQYGRIQSPRPDVMPDRREGITRAAGFVFACIDTQTS